VKPALRKVRIRSFWLVLVTGAEETAVRTYEVTGPTGMTVARTGSFAAAVGHADRESRRFEWRQAAGVHDCSVGALLRSRPVGSEGIYCGHGRFLGAHDALRVDGVPTRIGRPEVAERSPLVPYPLIRVGPGR